MSWFKVDDKLHDHRKVRKAGKSAMGVWVLAGSWSMFAEMDGFVPDSVLARWGTRRDAQTLVDVGFWDVAERNGESGWQFHDWLKYQPDARTLALVREAESEAGSFGNHKRWHTNRKVKDPECKWCTEPPAEESA
jgi:hypothetical protein